MCAHSCLTGQDTDQGSHVFYRCKNPKPSSQERNKVQTTLDFSFQPGLLSFVYTKWKRSERDKFTAPIHQAMPFDL